MRFRVEPANLALLQPWIGERMGAPTIWAESLASSNH